jgi:D-serine deaminase-like pyridoxal phosphate-dependent protein
MKLGRIGIVVAAVVATLFYAVRPRDDGGGYDPYFQALNEMMKREGPARPVLLLDLDRLDQNIAVLKESIRPPAFRVVDKSLPSIPLLRYIFEHAGTESGDVVPPAVPEQVTTSCPAARCSSGSRCRSLGGQFYTDLHGTFDPDRQLQWLIDTPERLEYRALAALAPPHADQRRDRRRLHRGGGGHRDASTAS